jgi:hypothetical protein
VEKKFGFEALVDNEQKSGSMKLNHWFLFAHDAGDLPGSNSATACEALLRDYIRKHTTSLHECSWSLDTRESPSQ